MSVALLDSLKAGFDASPSASDDVRREAFASALSDGVPTPRAERWKYTSLRALERRSFATSAALLAPVDAALLADIPAPRVVLVNGRFDASLSDTASLPEGIALRPLAHALADGDARETSFLARRFSRADETFANLNAAFASDGLVLRVEENS